MAEVTFEDSGRKRITLNPACKLTPRQSNRHLIAAEIALRKVVATWKQDQEVSLSVRKTVSGFNVFLIDRPRVLGGHTLVRVRDDLNPSKVQVLLGR